MTIQCDHIYGVVWSYDPVEITEDNYDNNKDDPHLEKYTYCPFCRKQLHTLDGVPIGIYTYDEDDCQKRGCAD